MRASVELPIPPSAPATWVPVDALQGLATPAPRLAGLHFRLMKTLLVPLLTSTARQASRGLLLIALVAQLVWLTPVLAADTASVPGPVDPFADVLPAALAAAERAAPELSAVTMDVALDPAAGTIGGEMTVAWRNTADVPLPEVWFRLFPNAGYYGEGSLAIADLTVDGVPVMPELAMDETALRVPLPEPVAPGESAEIAMAFTTIVPADATGSFGIFQRDTEAGSWVLADWHPILAVYEDEDGWALPAVTPFGDPTYAPSAFYDVRVTAPDDLEVVATGVIVDESEENGAVTRRFAAGPSRDFVLVADDDHTPISTEVDGTRLTLWTAPTLADGIAEQTLDVAADALRYYSDLLGPYPAREVDLVQVDPSGALGVAWAGLLYLDGPALLETYGAYDPDGLASVVGHEVAHLWWGILIGGDSNDHPFIQEGLATVSSLLFLEATLGPEAAAGELDAWVIAPARRLLAAGDAIVDLPIAEGQNETIRSDAAYGKGSLGFLAIRQDIGNAAFTAALRDIATTHTWGEIEPDDLRAAFERASGRNLTALWSHWFDETAMTAAEIDALAGVMGDG